MLNINRIRYYFKRLKEASIISIVKILIIKIKRKSFRYYYYPSSYSFLFKPKFTETLFNVSDTFGPEFEKLLRVNKTTFKDVIFDDEVYKLIQQNKFPCLGYGIGKIPVDDAWHRDQFHDFEWRQDYFDKIDFVSIHEYSDVKVPWEYSRLQFLIFYALDFVKDEKQDVTTLLNYGNVLTNWISSNPPGYGVNWICNMEVSIRVVNISISYLLLKKYLSKEIRKNIEISILEHNKFITSFPELSDVPGNHYLSNLMGSYISCFVIYGEKSKSTKRYLKKFIEEADNEFLSDGCHFEMATVYHRLCLDFVGIVLAFSHRYNTSVFNQSLLDIYKNGVDFCFSISNDYILSMFGDFDSGHVVWLGNNDRDFEYLAQFYSIIKTGYFSGKCHSQTLLLSTIAGIKPERIIQHIEKDICVFEKSGFLSSHQNSLTSVIRVGPQGLKGRASHDHDDALNLWLSYQGQDVLVDEGCHSYSLDLKERKKCIVSSGHNVHKIFDKERFTPVLGSIVNTVRGACISSNYSSKVVKNVCFQEAELDINLSSDFILSKRSVELYENSVNKLCVVNDFWHLKQHNKTDVRWRFDTKVKPEILLNNNNYKTIKIDFKDFICNVEIKSTVKFTVNPFEFEFASKYGFTKKCYGLHVVFFTSIEGEAQVKFLINDK